MFDATLTRPDPEGPLRALAAMMIVLLGIVLAAAAVALTSAWAWVRYALLYLLFLLLGGVAPTLPSLEPPPVELVQLEIEIDDDTETDVILDEGSREPAEVIGQAPAPVDPDAVVRVDRANEPAKKDVLRMLGTIGTLSSTDSDAGTVVAILGTTGGSDLASVLGSGDLDLAVGGFSGVSTGEGGMLGSLGDLSETRGAGGMGSSGGSLGGGTPSERVYRQTSDQLGEGDTVRCRVEIHPTESSREGRIHVHDCLRKHHQEVRAHVERRGLDARARTFIMELRAADHTGR